MGGNNSINNAAIMLLITSEKRGQLFLESSSAARYENSSAISKERCYFFRETFQQLMTSRMRFFSNVVYFHYLKILKNTIAIKRKVSSRKKAYQFVLENKKTITLLRSNWVINRFNRVLVSLNSLL